MREGEGERIRGREGERVSEVVLHSRRGKHNNLTHAGKQLQGAPDSSTELSNYFRWLAKLLSMC
jgi:hypothetical protein